MAAYLLGRLKIHDRARFLGYAAAARDIALRYGVKYLATKRPVQILRSAEPVQPIFMTEWPTAGSTA